MGMLILTGERSNLIAAAISAPTASGAAASEFPVSELYDGSMSPMRFNAAGTDDKITVDLNRITNGTMETANGSEVSGWTDASTGAGGASRTTSAGEFNGGAAGAKLQSGAGGVGLYYQDITVRPGELLKIETYLKASNSAHTARVRIQNRHTGKYLTSAGAWQTASADCITHTGNTDWTAKTLTFAIEEYSAIERTTCTLRVMLVATGTNEIIYADDVFVYPGVTFCSLHGYNFDASIWAANGILLQSSPDNSSWTTRATMSGRQPSCYEYFAVQYLRYWRVLFTGTNTTPIYIGEWILGQPYLLELTMLPRHPAAEAHGINYLLGQVRHRSTGGAIYRVRTTTWPARTLDIPFRHHSEDDEGTLDLVTYRRQVMELSVWGTENFVVVPSTDEEDVILGAIPEEWDLSKFLLEAGDHVLRVEEFGFPVLGM